MNISTLPEVDHNGLIDLIVNMGTSSTIMIWGPPGIGKSELIEQVAQALGMPLTILLGSQMSPEDLSVPLINPERKTTVMCVPDTLYSEVPQIIFIDEFNGAEPDVMRAFFSLINERRIGSYRLPRGSVVICAGNPTEHNSVARPVPSPAMSRMFHVQLKLKSTKGWLEWAQEHAVHPLITGFIREEGLNVLLGKPGDDDQISTNPRTWVIASHALKAFGITEETEISAEIAAKIALLAQGAVAAPEAQKFGIWLRNRASSTTLSAVLRGEAEMPDPHTSRASCLYLMDVLSRRLGNELPHHKGDASSDSAAFATRSAQLLADLGRRAPEVVAAALNNDRIPAWFNEEVGLMASRTSN